MKEVCEALVIMAPFLLLVALAVKEVLSEREN